MPGHTGKDSERDKNTHKYIDSDKQTKQDRHWDKQTHVQRLRHRE